ncbi:MAG: hypothetical protein ABGY72_16370, partial [bacterium]
MPGVSLAAVLLGLTLPGFAQLRIPELQIEPVTETDAAHPGAPAAMALEVALNAGFHLQSNAPLDESLIPT